MNLDELLKRLADARDLNVPNRERENLCASAYRAIFQMKEIMDCLERGLSFPEDEVQRVAVKRLREALAIDV